VPPISDIGPLPPSHVGNSRRPARRNHPAGQRPTFYKGRPLPKLIRNARVIMISVLLFSGRRMPMQVKDIMSRHVELASPEMTIQEAARTMRAGNFGALPVGENDHLIGMVTDRDIVMRAVADDYAPSETAIRAVMSERICYCFEEDSLDEAAGAMAEHQIRRLPVLNRNKRLVGMVTLADLSRCAPDTAKAAFQGVSKATDEARHLA
jgi:CBS domain-containing protein